MKKFVLILATVFSWALTAAVSPRTCDQHLQGSDFLVEGIVKNIDVNLDCWTELCNFYSLQYTADLLVTNVIKGDGVESGQTIKLGYEDNFQSPREGEYPRPGFQGHSPLPNKWDYWTVFLNRSDNNFSVAAPNGWWSQNDSEEHCW